jgi:hypothetical protein
MSKNGRSLLRQKHFCLEIFFFLNPDFMLISYLKEYFSSSAPEKSYIQKPFFQGFIIFVGKTFFQDYLFLEDFFLPKSSFRSEPLFKMFFLFSPLVPSQRCMKKVKMLCDLHILSGCPFNKYSAFGFQTSRRNSTVNPFLK